jgi:hypothetical protein
VDQVRAMVPEELWCEGHDEDQQPQGDLFTFGR